MLSGIYQSAAGMDSLMRLQEALANNLANVQTNGFKQERIRVENREPGRLETRSSLDEKRGGIQVTQSSTQLAILGEGFFEVETAQGLAYTRDGDFHVDAQGRLVNENGDLAQGQSGDIEVGSGKVEIGASGEVRVDGETKDRLRVVTGEGIQQRLGGNLVTWADTDSIRALEPEQVRIQAGALESSNVNMLSSMVDMLAATRLYEANQQALQSQDETVKQAVSQIGRPA